MNQPTSRLTMREVQYILLLQQQRENLVEQLATDAKRIGLSGPQAREWAEKKKYSKTGNSGPMGLSGTAGVSGYASTSVFNETNYYQKVGNIRKKPKAQFSLLNLIHRMQIFPVKLLTGLWNFVTCASMRKKDVQAQQQTKFNYKKK